MTNWYLFLSLDPDPIPQHRMSINIPFLWSNPTPSFLKLNLDGASKGNPGPVGFGVVFQVDQGCIQHILVGILGHDSNNVVKLWVLTWGIQTTS